MPVPNQVGLPGRSATPQKTSSTPSSASAGFTWSCGSDRDPPVVTATSSAQVQRPHGRGVVVADGLHATPPPRRRRSPAPRARSRSYCGSAGASVAGLHQLVAGDHDRHPGPAAHCEAPRPPRRPRRARRRPGAARVQHHARPPRCPRRRAGSPCRPPPPRSTGPALSRVLDPHDRVGAGDLGAGRDPHGLARAGPRASPGPRRATRPRASSSTGASVAPRGVSALTAKPSIAELSKGGTSSRLLTLRGRGRAASRSGTARSGARPLEHERAPGQPTAQLPCGARISVSRRRKRVRDGVERAKRDVAPDLRGASWPRSHRRGRAAEGRGAVAAGVRALRLGAGRVAPRGAGGPRRAPRFAGG